MSLRRLPPHATKRATAGPPSTAASPLFKPTSPSSGVVYAGVTAAPPARPVALKTVDARFMRSDFLRKQTIEEVVIHKKATAIGHPAILNMLSACVGADETSLLRGARARSAFSSARA